MIPNLGTSPVAKQGREWFVKKHPEWVFRMIKGLNN